MSSSNSSTDDDDDDDLYDASYDYGNEYQEYFVEVKAAGA